MIEYVIFLRGLAQQRRPRKKLNLAQRYSLGVRMMPTSNTRVAQRKRVISHATMKNNRNMACVLMTALCNQPEACASDLGDNQSPYLLLLKRTLVTPTAVVKHFIQTTGVMRPRSTS